MTLKTNNANGGSNGVAVVVNDASSGSAWQNIYGTAPTYDSTAIAGALSLLFAAASGATSMVEWTGLSGSAMTIGCSMRAGKPSQTTTIGAIRPASGKISALQYANTGTLQVVNASDAIIYTSAALTDGTDYDWALRTIPGTGEVKLGIYLKGSTTPVEPVTTLTTQAIGAGPAALARFGKVSASTWASTLRMDNFQADDSGPWPLPSLAAPAPTLTAFGGPVTPAVIVGVATPSSGGALTYAITQTTGPALTPTLVAPGVWTVDRHTTTARVYQVAVTESGTGLTRTQDVTVAAFNSEAAPASQFYAPTGANGTAGWAQL